MGMSWLLFVHILAAMVWLGGGVMLLLIAAYTRSSSDPHAFRQFARVLPYAGLRALTPSVVVLLITGVWMILGGVGWSFSQLWVQLALGLFALAFLVGAVYMSRLGIQINRTLTSFDVDPATANRLLNRWMLGYGIVVIILLAALWDMVFKPGMV